LLRGLWPAGLVTFVLAHARGWRGTLEVTETEV